MSVALRFVEVGPRDGLQNEKQAVPLATKVRFIDDLAAAGVSEIEAGAFVSPKAVPQMADSSEVFAQIQRQPGVLYSALVPNERGLERAFEAKADKISVFTAASESFNQKNIQASIKESIERFKPVANKVLTEQLPLRGYVSTAFHCPYEGPVAPEAVLNVVEELLGLGVDEVSIGDTIGKASPTEVRTLLSMLLKRLEGRRIALHFHDTYGMAIANALTAWREFDIGNFDSSAGGLGGCPYAPGASGNVATEDLAFAFTAEGGETGLDIEKLKAATAWVPQTLGHAPASHLAKI
jgi:hydroxymethylglutaryl-CoA lyase